MITNNVYDSSWAPIPQNTYFHIYSDGKTSGTLLMDEADFIYAKNLLARTAYINNVELLALAVMDTHFHLVAKATLLTSDKFKVEYQRRLLSYLTKRYGSVDVCFIVQCDPIASRKELLRKIIYVYKNPIGAGFKCMPEYYKWGVGQLYFNGCISKRVFGGNRIGDLTTLEQRSLFHSLEKLPQDWRYDDTGLILTDSYVNYELVNEIFGTVNTFITFMHTKKDEDAEITIHCHKRIIDNMTETDCRKQVTQECKLMFNKKLVNLVAEEKVILAKTIKTRDPGYSISRLSRILKIDVSLLEALLK